MTYEQALQYVEKKLGKAPRRFWFWDKRTWYIQDKPGWKWQNDAIKCSLLNWDKCFRQGKLAWGQILQTNTIMYDESADLASNCPGEVMIWTDEDHPFDADTAAEIAESVYDLKGRSAELEDAEERRFAQNLEDEMQRPYGRRIPHRLCYGYNLRSSTIFYQRRHIPGPGHALTGSFFPVLYLDDPMVVVMVPYRFWPPELLEDWRG